MLPAGVAPAPAACCPASICFLSASVPASLSKNELKKSTIMAFFYWN
jgi:hypothetical protein